MTKLTPSQFQQIKNQYKVGPSNFDKYFTRQGNDIYSKDQAPAQPAQPQEPDYRAMYGLPDLEQKATQAQTDYASASGGQQAFLDALKKALLGQDTQTQGLQTERERLQKEQYTQPTSERERLIAAGIDDPFERQKRISEALGTTDSALSAVSSRLAGLGKTREDLVQQGVKGYEADLATKDESRRAAADALKEAMGLITKSQQADIAKKEKAAEYKIKRQEKVQDEALAYQRKLDLESFKAKLKPKKGTGGGTGGGGGGIIGFTKTQKLKLEAAGLSDNTRQEQLDYLYGEKTTNAPTEADINKMSPEAQAVINGTLRLEDLTPTTRGKIAGELNQAGFSSKPKLSSAQKEDLATMAGVRNQIKQIEDYNADGKLEGIGSLGFGSIKSWLAQVGVGSEEGRNVRSLIGNIKGTIAKLRGGTSFTENEERLLNTYVPTINDHSNVVITKINLLKQFIDDKEQNLQEYSQDRVLPESNNNVKMEDLRNKYNY